MSKSNLLEMALDKIMGDMDDFDGKDALSHSKEDCPDPLNCKMHDEEGPKEGDLKDPALMKVEVKKVGIPEIGSLGEGEKADDKITPEEAEILKKLLSKSK